MIKSYAAFIANTIRPMLDRAQDLLDSCDKHGLHLTRPGLEEVFTKFFHAHLVTLGLQLLTQILLALILCWTVIQVL